jgi:hypothetical protein
MKSIFHVLLSSLFGMLPTGVVATVYFAVANFRANDGPYFPPPLLALLIVVPVACLLLPVQGMMLTWHRLTGRPSVSGGWTAGAIGGVVAGSVLGYGLGVASPPCPGQALGLVGMGLVQGCATLVCLAVLLRACVESGSTEAH